ncbi:YbaN family protein [Ancylobacter terrae]|uniref:YbaN family protein n=1 Tax=Ancylobacter sp. sgz301288 TaxID=3342077 RepID=UPI003858BD7B
MHPTEKPHLANSALRWLLFAAGWLCVGIGVVGLILPGLPGTVFLILAAWLFARSSPRFEAWLLAHPRLGPNVRRWRERGVIPAPAKVVACVSMGASFGIMTLAGVPVLGLAGAGVSMLAAAAYMLSRPSA